MGRNGKNREYQSDWEEMADEADRNESPPTDREPPPVRVRNSRRNDQNDHETFVHNRRDSKMSNHEEPQDFDVYLNSIKDLEKNLAESKTTIKAVRRLYEKQRQEIQAVSETTKELAKVKEDRRSLQSTLKIMQREVEDELSKQKEEMEQEIERLRIANEDVKRNKKALEEERLKANKRATTTQAVHENEMAKERQNLETQYKEKIASHMKAINEKSKAQLDKDEKEIANLKAQNEKLSQELEATQATLVKARSACEEQDRLKETYKRDAEGLKRQVELAENEFGLTSKTLEEYKKQFLQIQEDVETLTMRYFKTLPSDIGDLNELREKIEKVDPEFARVPLSNSKPSEELRIIHARRVIATQLQEIIWRPFSSEATYQNPAHATLFEQIFDGLVAHYRDGLGLRAAKTFTALAMRGIQAQPTPRQSHSTTKSSNDMPDRAQAFAKKVMSVLSPLITPLSRVRFEGDIRNVALSAISIWDAAQVDECEVMVELDLDPAALEGWRENIPDGEDGVIVLFPRVTARSCSRVIDSHNPRLPGTFSDEKPHFEIHENTIVPGKGLGRWSDLVIQGAAEEQERKRGERLRKLKVEWDMLNDPSIDKKSGH